MKSNEEAREMRRLNKVSNANRPAGYDIPAKPQHTPIDTDALMVCLLGVGYLPDRAAFIVIAVNALEELLAIVKSCRENNGKCYSDNETLDDVISHAEGR